MDQDVMVSVLQIYLGDPFLRLECCYGREYGFYFEWWNLEEEAELL